MFSKTACASSLLLALLPLASVAGDANVLVNPGFENGTEGWASRNATITAVATPVHGGAQCAKVAGRSANWQGIKQSLFGKLVEGVPYRISGWVRLANASSARVAVSVEQQDDSGTSYNGVASTTATDGDWAQLSGEFTLHRTGVLAVLDVYFEGPDSGVDFYVDEVSVYGPEVISAKPVPVPSHALGQVDLGTRHQRIEGLGASGAYYTANLAGHKDKLKLYELLFRDLGLDILRIRNTYDIDPENFRETAEIVKGAKAVLGDKLRIMISSWTPPAVLKSDNKLTGGGTLAKRDGQYVYAEFAQWWADSLKAYAAAGVRADYVNMQNETNYPAVWESCLFAPNAAANPDQASYDTAFEAVWQKLHAQFGPAMPKMLAPETSSIGDAKTYIAAMSDLSHVYGYAHHLYDCDGCGSTPDRYAGKMAGFDKFSAEHGSKPVFQTEYEYAPSTWAGAMNTALLIHNSLTVENVAAYLYWDLFWGPGSGLVSLDSPTSYTVKPAFYAFKQFSAFVDSNWQRVEATTDSPGLRISAYVSPDRKKLTAVILNTTPATDVTLRLTFKGLPASTGKAYRSSESEKCVRVRGYKGKGPLTLPANSITTVSLAVSRLR